MYSNPSCLSSYHSGIITEDSCHCSNSKTKEVNHAVTIVGYGESDRPGCKEYWLVKNSWGPNWGENGFFKLCADIDQNKNP